MPFPAQDAKAFSRREIMTLQDGQMGVYGLYKDEQWVYVGGGNIRGRLVGHLNRDNNCIGFNAPTHMVFEITDDHENRVKALIEELHPTCNP
jgi:hypothetical protein